MSVEYRLFGEAEDVEGDGPFCLLNGLDRCGVAHVVKLGVIDAGYKITFRKGHSSTEYLVSRNIPVQNIEPVEYSSTKY